MPYSNPTLEELQAQQAEKKEAIDLFYKKNKAAIEAYFGLVDELGVLTRHISKQLTKDVVIVPKKGNHYRD